MPPLMAAGLVFWAIFAPLAYLAVEWRRHTRLCMQISIWRNYGRRSASGTKYIAARYATQIITITTLQLRRLTGAERVQAYRPWDYLPWIFKRAAT